MLTLGIRSTLRLLEVQQAFLFRIVIASWYDNIIDLIVHDEWRFVFPDKPLPPEKEAAAAVSLPTEA